MLLGPCLFVKYFRNTQALLSFDTQVIIIAHIIEQILYAHCESRSFYCSVCIRVLFVQMQLAFRIVGTSVHCLQKKKNCGKCMGHGPIYYHFFAHAYRSAGMLQKALFQPVLPALASSCLVSSDTTADIL